MNSTHSQIQLSDMNLQSSLIPRNLQDSDGNILAVSPPSHSGQTSLTASNGNVYYMNSVPQQNLPNQQYDYNAQSISMQPYRLPLHSSSFATSPAESLLEILII